VQPSRTSNWSLTMLDSDDGLLVGISHNLMRLSSPVVAIRLERNGSNSKSVIPQPFYGNTFVINMNAYMKSEKTLHLKTVDLSIVYRNEHQGSSRGSTNRRGYCYEFITRRQTKTTFNCCFCRRSNIIVLVLLGQLRVDQM